MPSRLERSVEAVRPVPMRIALRIWREIGDRWIEFFRLIGDESLWVSLVEELFRQLQLSQMLSCVTVAIEEPVEAGSRRSV
jgi:hypothetical protein